MKTTYTAEAKTVIHAPSSQVWHALTTPEIIKQYMFGSDVVTDWKRNSPIVYKGMWQGKPFEDKGRVLEVEPEKLLLVTHWSPMSGVPDSPENYHKVRYELKPENGNTTVTISQDNNASADEQKHSEKNWQLVLDQLKNLLEAQTVWSI